MYIMEVIMMYLIEMEDEVKTCKTLKDLKAIPKDKIVAIYSLTAVDYDTVILKETIQDCIYNYLKGHQYPKQDVIDYVADSLGMKRAEVSKVIVSMKKDKIIYTVKKDDVLHGCIGIL